MKKRIKIGGTENEERYTTIEELFDYKGFKCMVIFNEIIISNPKLKDIKWRCGYVGVKKGHPLYKKEYNKIDELVIVHGGLTFSNIGDSKVLSKNYWWLGFDCNHYKDKISYWTFKRVKKEVKEMARQMTIKNLVLKGLENDN